MNAKDRRQIIHDVLVADGSVTVDQLASRLHVTQSTIRRDLTRLTTEGKITRTYGGAISLRTTLPEPTLHERETLARAEKEAIGAWAAEQVSDGETLILDAGTTVGRMAHHLRDHRVLVVITNGMTTVLELANADEIEVVVLGGTLRHVSQGLIGPLAELALSRLTADRVFLGADGLVPGLGICEASPVQTRLKELMAARAKQLYVLADSSKIGRAPFNYWASLDREWTLVTDDGVDDEAIAPWHALPNVTVVTVPLRHLMPVYGADDATARPVSAIT